LVANLPGYFDKLFIRVQFGARLALLG
jgi:hypothetical protein